MAYHPQRPHRWSGWPGAFCLDCFTEDPEEEAFALGHYLEVEDATSPIGFRFDILCDDSLWLCSGGATLNPDDLQII